MYFEVEWCTLDLYRTCMEIVAQNRRVRCHRSTNYVCPPFQTEMAECTILFMNVRAFRTFSPSPQKRVKKTLFENFFSQLLCYSYCRLKFRLKIYALRSSRRCRTNLNPLPLWNFLFGWVQFSLIFSQLFMQKYSSNLKRTYLNDTQIKKQKLNKVYFVTFSW